MHHDRHYRSALGSRDIIGQAKGMLMERSDVDAVAAFALLTRLSEESHRPVVVVAKELLETNAGYRPLLTPPGARPAPRQAHRDR